MRRACAWIAALMLAAAGCTNVKQVPDESAVRNIIDSQNQELVECWNGGEYECVAAAFSEDGWQMMPNAQAQAGTEAIGRFWQQAFGWGQWEFSAETSLLEQSGPVAIERGKYVIRFASDAAAPPGATASGACSCAGQRIGWPRSATACSVGGGGLRSPRRRP